MVLVLRQEKSALIYPPIHSTPAAATHPFVKFRDSPEQESAAGGELLKPGA